MVVDKIKVSIIIPVYKAESHLHRCVDSLLNQTFRHFEVLLVDDGSPDHSGDICDEYARKDKRVRVFHKENGGATSARSYGVQHALGEYISFVDADDDVPVDALDMLLGGVQSEKYDIVIGKMDVKASYPQEELSVLTYRSCSIFSNYIPSSPWGRLFRRSLFTSDTFDIPRTVVMGEDMLMNIRIAFANTKPVRLVNQQVYNYFSNPESCTHSFQSSLEYEVLFDKYRRLSIPDCEREKYVCECVLSKIKGLMLIADSTYKNTWTKTTYFQELVSEIRTHSIKIPLLVKFKLYTTNPFAMKVIIKVERLRDKFIGLLGIGRQK